MIFDDELVPLRVKHEGDIKQGELLHAARGSPADRRVQQRSVNRQKRPREKSTAYQLLDGRMTLTSVLRAHIDSDT